MKTSKVKEVSIIVFALLILLTLSCSKEDLQIKDHVSNLELAFPKADMDVSTYNHWNDFYGSSQRYDTLNRVYEFITSPDDFEVIQSPNGNSTLQKEFVTGDSIVDFVIWSSFSNGENHVCDSLLGSINLFPTQNKMNVIMEFFRIRYEKQYHYNDKSESYYTYMRINNVPYTKDNSVIISEIGLPDLDTLFYSYSKYERRDAAWGGESIESFQINKFENNQAGQLKIYYNQ